MGPATSAPQGHRAVRARSSMTCIVLNLHVPPGFCGCSHKWRQLASQGDLSSTPDLGIKLASPPARRPATGQYSALPASCPLPGPRSRLNLDSQLQTRGASWTRVRELRRWRVKGDGRCSWGLAQRCGGRGRQPLCVGQRLLRPARDGRHREQAGPDACRWAVVTLGGRAGTLQRGPVPTVPTWDFRLVCAHTMLPLLSCLWCQPCL